MATPSERAIRDDLMVRRERLEAALERPVEEGQLRALLAEVDAALDRLEQGTYGLCEQCHEPIEAHRLAANPLICYCIDHLTVAQRRALESDLELASSIQRELLPPRHLRTADWEVAYHYEGLGPVSGDYCDLIQVDGGTLYFMIGDASGKGVAASMLMSQLHAIFRTLVHLATPVDQLLDRANRVFCDAKLPGQFATLVAGRAERGGVVEISNAGHCPPLVVRGGAATELKASGFPLGMFCDSRYGVTRVELGHGDGLLIYTDGVSEARSASGSEYGTERLARLTRERRGLAPELFIRACLEDLIAFRSGADRHDDLTLMALQRVG